MNILVVTSALVGLLAMCEGLRPIGRTVKLTHADRAMLINYHNDLRREAHASNMQVLSWDREGARAARHWGRMCNYDRPRNDGYGENIFYNNHDNSEPTREVAMDALGAWSKEKVAFNPHQSCTKTRSCDYLKMMTANVESVGCAVTVCPVLRTSRTRRQYNVNFVTCFYTPIIDIRRTEPYLHGEPCTYCRQGYSCRRGLCSPPLLSMGSVVIKFGEEYDKQRTSRINHIIPSKSISQKPDTSLPETNVDNTARLPDNTLKNIVPQTKKNPTESRRREHAELRRGRTKTRIYRGRTSGQFAQGNRLQELTSSRGGLSDDEEYYLLQLHNNLRTTGIAKLKWSKRLERWARYVIRCDVEYPGPAFCFTNFGKIDVNKAVYNIVYDWDREGSDLTRKLATGCRTPYDRSLCNHHIIMQNRDIRELACASLNCGRQRQVTCIYQ